MRPLRIRKRGRREKNIMVTCSINHQSVKVKEGTTILEAAKKIGIEIPHLCYLKGINEVGACRVCCVEVKGEASLVSSCNTPVKEGMEVITDSPRVRMASLNNLQLIMSQHNGTCSLCDRSGECQLRRLTNHYDFHKNLYPQNLPSEKDMLWDQDFPLIRDSSRCIKCMRCINVCDKIQSVGIWTLMGTGERARVAVKEDKLIENTECVLCGQCITHCPTGALRERKDTLKVLEKLKDPNTITVFQIAPAVRAAWQEANGLSDKDASVNRIAGALKMMGADYVFDTSFSADLTILEEANELLERKKSGELKDTPMFTSCCPGWIRFCKSQYPELVPSLSTSKSPMEMFGAVIKTVFAKRLNVSPEKICSVAIMPCVAKKAEASLPTMESNPGIPDIDYVLTTRELGKLFDLGDIDLHYVKDAPFDRLFGDYSGAGVIFGTTGGVMEAALRSAHYFLTGKNPDPDQYHIYQAKMSEEKPWHEETYAIGGIPLHVAAVSGLANTRKLLERITHKEDHFDFVEVMACPGGCAGGGGQPYHYDDIERAEERGDILHKLDLHASLRFSHENPDIVRLYKEDLEKPLSEKAEAILHTDHKAWKMPTEA